MTSCDLRSTTLGWALSALEPDEERLVLDHLASCADCRRVLRETAEVTGALALALPPVDPPPGLRGAILDEARLDEARRDEPAVSPGPAAPGRPQTSPPQDSAGRDNGAPREGARGDGVPREGARGEGGPRDRSTPRPSGYRRRIAALALAAAAVLGVGILTGRAVLSTEPPPPPVAAAERIDRIVADARESDPATRHAVLRGRDDAPVAVVLDDPDEAAGPRLVPVAMPPTGPLEDYVLWGLGGPAPVALGTVGLGGETRPVPGAPARAAHDAYAVSVEPAGRVPASPSSVVASGRTT